MGDLIKTAAQQTDGAAVALLMMTTLRASNRSFETISNVKIIGVFCYGFEKNL
jgi:hypothetical protein